MSARSRIGLLVVLLVLAIGATPIGVVAASAQSSETVYSDDMSNPATGLLSEASPDPNLYSFEYTNGQFIAQAVQTTYVGEISSTAGTPVLTNSNIAVDVGIGGADEREIYVFVGCRQSDTSNGYLFVLEPAAGSASLWREDPGNSVKIAEADVSDLVTPGLNQFNRIDIDCYLDLISASVNGEVVVAEFDSTYTSGHNYIGIGNTGGAADNLFGVFDNLVITDYGVESAPPDPAEDLTVTFAGLRSTAQAQPSVAGPLQGTITQDLDSFDSFAAGVGLADFYATVTFINPQDVSQPWDVGLGFRYTGSQPDVRFILESTGDWTATVGTDQTLGSGTVPVINTGPNQANTIEIIAQGTTGLASVNGVAVAQLTLPAFSGAGDVLISSGFFLSNVVDQRVVPFQSFQVWNLSGATSDTGPASFTRPLGAMIAGPLSGSLVEQADAIQSTAAGVNIADFYASVTFVVPADLSAPWDIILGFRDSGGGNHYRLTVASTGEWRLSIETNPPIATGTVTNLLTTPGQENRLDLVVDGVQGVAGLNGVDFATLDLSALTAPGDIWIGSASSNSTTLPGRAIPYNNFEVWSLA